MELSDSMACWKSQLDKSRSKLEMANSKLSTLQKEASRLRKSVARSSGVKDRAVAAAKAKAKQETSTHHLMNKGVFTCHVSIFHVTIPAHSKSFSIKSRHVPSRLCHIILFYFISFTKSIFCQLCSSRHSLVLMSMLCSELCSI
jgi:hypothetical protein